MKWASGAASVLARTWTREVGCDDAWLFDGEGFVTEGCAENAWIAKDGLVMTRPVGHEILAGVTRDRILALARAAGVEVVERKFTIAEALVADEAFNTSATALISP